MRGPPRLLLVLHRAARAGTERHAYWLACGMRDRGWEIAVAISETGPMASAFEGAGVAVRIVPRDGGPGAYAARLWSEIRALRPDVVHAHSGRLAAGVARLAGGARVVETRHGLGIEEEPPDPARLRREARRCRTAHATITVSAVDRSRLIEGGRDPRCIFHIPNGIPAREGIGRPISARGNLRLGFLGRLSRQKNPQFLAEVGCALERDAPGTWSLAIAGEGELLEATRAAFEIAGCSGRVAWLGDLEDPAGLWESCDFLLLPSLWEGQPLSALEAMQAGIVPIAADRAELRELLGGAAPAGLCLPLDAQRWGRALLALSADSDERGRLARNGMERIGRDHGLAPMIERTDAVYRGCLSRRHRD